MYKSILIPTDGSELAEKALRDGISLSKAIGAKITVLTVTMPFHIFTTDPKSIEDTRPQYNERMKRHAAKILEAAANAAKASGFPLDPLNYNKKHQNESHTEEKQ
jgi:nucleotide-binding universal stress UspA family protein